DSNEARFYRNSISREYIDTDVIESNVQLIKVCAGMDGTFIDFCVNQGTKGLVIEAMGRGNMPPLMALSVKKAIDQGVAVVIVSRCYKGRVLDSYGYEGGGKQLRDMGVIFGDSMPGQKARIKLILALGKTRKMEEIRKIFENGHY
ncbi:MAG: asparaginase, partial [Clostridium sp.]